MAAILQIRHLQAGNQLGAILRINERHDSPEMEEARRYCFVDLPKALTDSSRRNAIYAGELDPRLRLLASFYVEIGALIADGFLEERLINRLGPPILLAWNIVEPIAYALRKIESSPRWAAFEFLAVQQRRLTMADRLARYPRWFQAYVDQQIKIFAGE